MTITITAKGKTLLDTCLPPTIYEEQLLAMIATLQQQISTMLLQ